MPLDLEKGEPGESSEKKRGPGRPRKEETLGDLEKDMREQLEELAEWLRGRDADFAETFLADVPKMTKFLSARAGKHERLARVLRIVFAKDGPLAGLRAFGRTARKLLGGLNAMRERDEGEWPRQGADGNWYEQDGSVVVPRG